MILSIFEVQEQLYTTEREHSHKIKQENIFFEPFQSHILKDYNQTNYTFEKLLIKIYLSRREIKVS